MSSRTKMRGGKKEMDPEELMKRKFRAKCLFRALGRMVMANVYWLIEAIDEYEGLEDVKRRVEQAVRGKSKKKQLLSINDKALLNKAADERTEEERKYLYRIIGGLKCFKRYPNHVKKKLAAVTYYKYYGPGRTIVRQHHEAHAMYFIVSGDVVVTQMIFDELLQKHVSVEVGSMHTGDMFGEVSLLHNIKRTATVTTVDHCELLVLIREDFKNVLQASVQKQWDEVQDAMSAFTYFDALDEVSRREGCIVAKMKSYETNETVLGDGVGVPNFVYFILSGRCQMIESIQVTVVTNLGKNYYTLYDPYVAPEESEQDLDAKYFGAYKKMSKNSELKDETSIDKEQSTAKQSIPLAETSTNIASSYKKKSSILKPDSGRASVEYEEGIRPSTESSRIRLRSHTGSDSVTKEKDLLKPSEQGLRESIRLSVVPEVVHRTPKNVRTFFMQVCQFNPGSSFGFGENMRDRRIIALTPVDCMLLPSIWLLQKNTANIWFRIKHYLDKKIPSKKQLFKEFVSTRRWEEYREQIVSDVISRTNTVNWTTVHDVPYSIRIEEMTNI
ncbi:uncharacterized protein LOC106708529 [Papilio machaon]|uniref:uncharacterized protein LOC106708529 n=1 Tax=Papilio machaon TaxID=76193 RepID=UPI001E665D28|nr:uncharacterized protein LOC106708529 [Papilio machaon]